MISMVPTKHHGTAKSCTFERPGSLLIEALIAIAVFSVFATATFLALLTGQESSRTGSDRIRGIYYTDQSLEVAKSIRGLDFSELTTGRHGYTLDESGTWVFSGTDLSRYGYRSFMDIIPISDGRVRVSARTAWKHGYHRSGATVMTVELTDWRESFIDMGDWSEPTEVGNIAFAGTPYLGDVTVEGDYAYVTSSELGDGLYIFDISDESSPTRVSTGFTLGGAAHTPVVYHDTLYVAVEDGVTEVQAYDVTSPDSLDEFTVPIASFDLLGGSNRANTLVRNGTTLFVGADYHTGQDEVYALNISTPGTITELGGYDIADNPSVSDAYVVGNFLHLATDNNTQEMIVLNVSDPANMAFNSAYNGVDVHDGTAVRAGGTGFYLGRFQGSSIDEYLLITGTGGNPSNNPIDTHGADMGSPGQGTVNSLDIDPYGCYAFIATDFQLKELQIRSASHKTVEEETYVDLDTDGQGVFYNSLNDHLYMTTSTGFHIFIPGSRKSSCL